MVVRTKIAMEEHFHKKRKRVPHRESLQSAGINSSRLRRAHIVDISSSDLVLANFWVSSGGGAYALIAASAPLALSVTLAGSRTSTWRTVTLGMFYFDVVSERLR